MAGPLRGLMVGAACFATLSTVDAKVVYVNDDIVTPGDGSTWSKAFKYLRDALDNTVAGDQIYLTAGVYYPDDGKSAEGIDDLRRRELAFELEGQLIYGGFVGTETSITQRNPELNETVLSGDIWGWLGAGNETYRSLHVIVAFDSSTLDGVTVERGNANGTDWWSYPTLPFYDRGGACFLSKGKILTLNNCAFYENWALEYGGAIMVEGSELDDYTTQTPHVVATDCVFGDNAIPHYNKTTNGNAKAGGAISGNVSATNCIFDGNTIHVVLARPDPSSIPGAAKGGAIFGDVTALSCDFMDNVIVTSNPTPSVEAAQGGAIAGDVTATLCKFEGNSATSDDEADGGAIAAATVAGVKALKCIFSSNSATVTAGASNSSYGGAIRSASLRAVDCVFDSNASGIGYYVLNIGFGGGGALYVEKGSSYVTNCVFVGNTSLFRGGAIHKASDEDGDVNGGSQLLISNSTFMDNGVSDGLEGSTLSLGDDGTCIVRILNNIFWHTADAAGGFDQTNHIHVFLNGVLRNTDLNYPDPSSVSLNVIKGGTAGLSEDGGSDANLGNTSDTIITGDPLFANEADPDGADDIWASADDGLRITAGSSALGTSRNPLIVYRNFLQKDLLDVDEDANLTEFLPADIASFTRVQDTFLDMGAYEFGPLTHLPEIVVEQPLNTALVDGTALINFGSNPGVAVSKVFTIRNTGPANLNKLALTLTGANANNYTITQPASTVLTPGAVTSFTVAFKAGSVAGTRTATVHLASNDADENPFDINLTGESLVPEIAIEQPTGTELVDAVSTISYGTVSVLASSTRTFTIRNSGLGNLNIASISSTGANAGDFKIIQPVSKTLVTGTSTTFAVTFAPTAGGIRNATIVVQNNDPDAESSFQINVTGNGMVAPEIAVSQPASTPLVDGGSKSFGKVKIGLSYTKTFTIRNQGSSRLKEIDVSVSGANASRFTLVKPSVTGLDPGDKTTFTVSFKPTGTGLKTALIRIASNDMDEDPFDINIDGTGFSASKSKKRSALVADSGSGSGTGGSVTSQKGGDGLEYLVLTVKKEAGWSLSKHSVEVSSNLVDWFSGSKHTTILKDDADILRVRDNTPVGKDGKRYIRLK